MPESLRQLWTAVRALLALTLLVGVLYPAATLLVAATALGDQSRGSLITVDGAVRGSSLIGQNATGPIWFHPRPSAGDYDGLASGGSNAGPNDADLAAAVAERRATVARENGVRPDQVPADAVTASASGLDPYVSPAYADLQVEGVARARNLSPDAVRALVAEHTSGRTLGFLGAARVNVVTLNAALAGR